MSESTSACPAWCSGKHVNHGWGTTHCGEAVEVPLPGAAPGSLISVITITATELVLDQDAHYYLESSGPQIVIRGWGDARATVDLRDADRVAGLHKQLGNGGVADAINTVAATMNGEAGR